MGREWTRRGYLSGVVASTAGVVGCLDETSEESTPISRETTVATPTAEPTREPTTTETPAEADEPTPTETDEPTRESTPTETETSTETETPPEQPKIREVTDNFGNRLTFTDEQYPRPVGRATVEDELVVEDGMELRLCVTDVAAREDDELTYSYRFGNTRGDHPGNPAIPDRIPENCWTWRMDESHYRSEWSFKIWVRNDDEIYYQNDSVESDYRVDVVYTNLTLA